jgi:hypothetical protein
MLTLEEMGPWTSPGTVPVKRSIRIEPSTNVELITRRSEPAPWPGDYQAAAMADPNLVIANLELGHAERSPQHHKTCEHLVESTLSASEQERAGARGPFAFLPKIRGRRNPRGG